MGRPGHDIDEENAAPPVGQRSEVVSSSPAVRLHPSALVANEEDLEEDNNTIQTMPGAFPVAGVTTDNTPVDDVSTLSPPSSMTVPVASEVVAEDVGPDIQQIVSEVIRQQNLLMQQPEDEESGMSRGNTAVLSASANSGTSSLPKVEVDMPAAEVVEEEKKYMGCSLRSWIIIAIILALVVALAVALAVIFSGDSGSKDSSSANSNNSNNPAMSPTTASPTPGPAFPETPAPTPVPTPAPSTMAPTETMIVASLQGATNGDDFGGYVEFSGDGSRVAIGAPGGNYVEVYNTTSGERVGQRITGSNGRFGHRLDISKDGNTIVIGSPNANVNGIPNRGLVRAYRYDAENDRWNSLGQTHIGFSSADRLGWDVSISDDGARFAMTARTGTYQGTPEVGYVQVCDLDGFTWSCLQNVLGIGVTGDQFGRSVSLSGNGLRMAIGAVSGSGGKGIVYICDLRGNEGWTLVAAIAGNNVDDWLGTSVALSADGRVLAIGSDGTDQGGENSGSVTVYITGTTSASWTRRGPVIHGEVAGDQLGAGHISLSDNGEFLAVGSGLNNDNAGYAKLYQFVTGDWQEVETLRGENEGDKLGFSVTVSQDGRVFGAGATQASTSTPSPGYVLIRRV